MEYRFSKHALEEMVHRNIPRQIVESILQNPEQVIYQDDGLVVHQSRVIFAPGKTYLVRVFINQRQDPAVVVTLYRTSQIRKYERTS